MVEGTIPLLVRFRTDRRTEVYLHAGDRFRCACDSPDGLADDQGPMRLRRSGERPARRGIRAVIEDLDPWQARFSVIETASSTLRFDAIAAIYEQPEFPRPTIAGASPRASLLAGIAGGMPEPDVRARTLLKIIPHGSKPGVRPR